MGAWREIRQKIVNDWRQYRVGILAAVLLAVVLSVAGRGICPLSWVWGFPCPGCGMTRSLLLLFSGQPAASWEMHPFAGAWILYIAACGVERYVLLRSGRWKKAALVVLVGAMLLFYIYRMATLFPFQAPYIYIEGNLMERTFPGYKEIVHYLIDG